MPVYQDTNTKTWYTKFYYTDYTGTKRQKKKRGFKTQRDAKEWERHFLETQQNAISMLFEDFVQIYLNDMTPRLKESTIRTKKYMFDFRLLPYFGKMQLSDITPVVIRRWQNSILEYKDESGRPLSQTYINALYTHLAAVFNFAVKYYNLPENPCTKAGSIGKRKTREEMKIWTLEEFKTFLASAKPEWQIVFEILFFTGMRIGELLALTLNDIDFVDCTININKTCSRIDGIDVITEPKTPSSIRIISIPEALRNKIKTYVDKLYKPNKNDRLFPYCAEAIRRRLSVTCKTSGVKKIRLHDFRHSHASFLINIGIPIPAISKRLGHENPSITLSVYSHLYPDDKNDIAKQLQKYF